MHDENLFQNTNEDDNNNNVSIVALLNEMPLNTLGEYYDVETSIFKKRIDKLNLKFYYESETLVHCKEIPKPYNKLFLILFKEINLFTEEIDRLNSIIRDKNKNEKYFKEKIYELTQKEKDRILTKQTLKNYQINNKLLEKRLKEKTAIEDKLKTELDKTKHLLQNASCNSNNNNSSVNVNNKHHHHGSIMSNRTSRSIEMNISFNMQNNTSTKYMKTTHKKHLNDSINNHNGNANSNNNVNQSMYLTNKIFNHIQQDNNTTNTITTTTIDKCISHYTDEIDSLTKIESFLLKQKKDLKDFITKCTSLK